MRSGSLAHGRRRGLHPGGRETIRVGGHWGASHVRHGGRETVGSSMAAGCSMHAVIVPVLSRTRAHPRRPVRWWLAVVGS